MLHGWIMEVTPGAGKSGDFDLTWRIYSTKREGIATVHSQISPDWQWIRKGFIWGEDLQDYSGLHGLVALVRLNDPMPAPPVTWLGRHEIYSTFVFCGQLWGETMPFHTEEQAYEIIQWFMSKQEHWDAIYSKQSDGQAEEDAKASASHAGAGSTQRTARKKLH